MKKRKLPPGISQRGGQWWISYTVGGQRVRRAIGPCDSITEDDAVAARVNSISEAIRTGENIAPKAKTALPLRQLCDRFKESLPAGGRAAKKIGQYFVHLIDGLGGDIRTDQLSHVALVRYRTQRQREPITLGNGKKDASRLTSPSEVTHELSALRAAINWAERAGLPIGKGPHVFRRLSRTDRKGVFPAEVPNPPTVLSDVDVEALCEAMTAPYARLTRFLYRTGMRLGEALALRWDCVFDRETVPHVLLPRTKGGRPRIVPLSGEALAILRECPRTGDYAFTGSEGGRLQNVPRAWRTARSEAELPKARLHDLRHSFASHFIEAGGDVAALRDICGWRDLTVPSRYVHAAPLRALAILNGERAEVIPFASKQGHPGHNSDTAENVKAG